jgi:hypothetical protein
VAEVKADISREVELAELKNLQTSVEDAARSIEHSVKTGVEDAQKEFRDVQATLEDTGAELKRTEDALKQAVSDMQMPHMGTAIGNSSDLSAQSGSEVPPALDGPPPLTSAPSFGVSPRASTEFSPPATQSVQPADSDDASPQMELALDPAREPLTRRQA